MEIISASDEVVITNMGITYLSYTFSPSFGRFKDLKQNATKLQNFLKSCENTPDLYDVKIKTKNNEEYISLTAKKPQFKPLSEQDITLTIEDISSITTALCNTLEQARNQNIYHLDIGFHTICYDNSLYKVEIIDWFDSILSKPPIKPPIYITENIPPELKLNKNTITEKELIRAENYQVSCILVKLLRIANINIPQVIQYGCSDEIDERPTLKTIKQSIEELQATY